MKYKGFLKSIKYNHSILFVCLFGLIIVLFTFGILSYSLITSHIINKDIKNIERLSVHYEQTIETLLGTRWNALEKIGEHLRLHGRKNTRGMLEDLGFCKCLLDCTRLSLVSNTGTILNSNLIVSKDINFAKICAEHNDKFVFRKVNNIANVEGIGEILIVGIKIADYKIDDIVYKYLVARLDIDSIEKDLKVNEYVGGGYSAVIDNAGDYIVSINRNYNAKTIDNFFENLSTYTLQKGYTPQKVQELILQEKQFSFVIKKKQKQVIFCLPMQSMQWYFVVFIPYEVFIARSMSLVKIVITLISIMLVLILLAIALIIQHTLRNFVAEKKHHHELATALTLAEQANRAKTVFLNNMSHDIRTPMNAIIGFTTLALSHIDNKERVSDYLNKISQSSSHLLSLINDVLDMSRIESGKLSLEEKRENLAEILHNIRNIVQADIKAKQLELFMDTIDVYCENVYCDKLRVTQVLLNIISNAIKFTPPGGSVSICISQHDIKQGVANYEFNIKDTGIGMNANFISTMFEPFARERNSTVSGIQGTGLGLSITKNIVDLMKGSIKVNSTEGKGTEFVVTLPLRLCENVEEVQTISCLEGLRALVADDDSRSCQSVTRMLRQIGMKSDWTMYGKEAVIRTEEAAKLGEPFHVCIIDWLMPDMNGVETARRIRKAVGASTPIIILSAYDWSQIEDEAKDAGVSGFVSKPLFLSDLRRILLDVCSPQSRQVQLEEHKARFIGRRLLLVEDNEFNREIASEVLKNEGFVVDIAENGKVAVDIISESRPGWYDAILMDIQMPIMDGYEASRSIRALANPALAHIPIIAMTANAFDEDKMAAFAAGMDAHIGKPIDISVLLSTLQKAIK